jgi:amino acid transporter
MRSSTDQVQDGRSVARLAIVRTLLIQVFVMLAVSGAVIGYLKWSSDAAWKEFIDADKSPAPNAQHHSQASTPFQTAHGPAICTRRA